MSRRTASAALSALLFAQGLLGLGALASALLNRAVPEPVVAAAELPAAVTIR